MTNGTMTPSNREPTMVTGLFTDRGNAERAFRVVTAHGYDTREVNVVIDDDTRRRYFPGTTANASELDSKAAQGGELGGPKGGTLGMLFTAVTAVGTFLLVPGLVIAGPLAVALTGAGAAAVTGGLIGALSDWGIPNERTEDYEAAIKAGGILLGVKPRTDEDARYFAERWKAIGGENVHS